MTARVFIAEVVRLPLLPDLSAKEETMKHLFSVASLLLTACETAHADAPSDERASRSLAQEAKELGIFQSSVWSGSFQPPAGDPYPMVIYVVERNKHRFTATTWYPTLNTLVSASGAVDLEGNVMFTEEELIYRKSGTASAGAKYVGTTDGKVWNSDCEYVDGRKGKFQLKLAAR